jgi:hypothetical protein
VASLEGMGQTGVTTSAEGSSRYKRLRSGTAARQIGRNRDGLTMKLKMITYWTATALIALETFAGGIVDLTDGRLQRAACH